MKNYVIIVFGFVLMGCVSKHKSKQYNLTRTINKDVVSVKIITEKGLDDLFYKDVFLWGEEFFDKRTSVVRRFDITMNQKKILIPYSFFGDLANLRSIDIKKERESFVLEVVGGAEHIPYKVLILINSDEGIVERKLESSTFPSYLNQKDVFKMNFPENM